MSHSQNVDPSISRIADLQQLIANFSRVDRALNLADTGRPENDVDHSYGLALTCWFLAPKIAPQLSLQKILMYALSHDMVEIYSGDTFVFDEAAVKTKQSREAAAIATLQAEWPDFPELTDYVQGYADKRDAEARFVYTIDKLLPPLLINIGEKEVFWNRHKITRQMHETEKNNKMQHSPEALPYLAALNEWLANPDYFYKPSIK
jgi:putative hydrolase of HD superfamily